MKVKSNIQYLITDNKIRGKSFQKVNPNRYK